MVDPSGPVWQKKRRARRAPHQIRIVPSSRDESHRRGYERMACVSAPHGRGSMKWNVTDAPSLRWLGPGGHNVLRTLFRCGRINRQRGSLSLFAFVAPVRGDEERERQRRMSVPATHCCSVGVGRGSRRPRHHWGAFWSLPPRAAPAERSSNRSASCMARSTAKGSSG